MDDIHGYYSVECYWQGRTYWYCRLCGTGSIREIRVHEQWHATHNPFIHAAKMYEICQSLWG